MTEEDIVQVLADYPTLDASGFRHFSRVHDPTGGIHPDGVQVCIEWLLHHDGLERRKSINRERNSYGWKHIVERKQNVYVSNGEFICAALYLGYRMSRELQSPNAFFNISSVFKEE